MNLSGWEFKENPWWNMDSQSIKYAAEKHGIRKVCAISRTALNDYFKTEDSREATFLSYAEHADMIR